MLDKQGFDLWADHYDRSVGISEDDGTYPFAGYREVLNWIYRDVLEREAKEILDIGFGTGTLTAKLYENGCHIWGQDFSDKMIKLAQRKMPQAKLYQGDFAKGLVKELQEQKYDAILATYSLHHLTDEEKVRFIEELLKLLKDGGKLYIGDVAFETREELNQCREQNGDGWDEEEIYFVSEEFKQKIGNVTFKKLSHCAGVFEIMP